MNEPRIDLSSLDPSRDRERWSRLVEDVARRATEAFQRPHTVADQLVIWLRPALSMAAGIAVAVWTTALLASPPPSSQPTTVKDPDTALVQWALGGERTSVWQEVEQLEIVHE